MTAAQLVPYIQNLVEGGYYHPDMKDRLKGGEKMGNSGETMFGLDRKAGAPDVTVGVPQEAFWRLVDQYYAAHHADTSYYGDMADGRKADIPASVGQQLRQYGSQIILQLLDKRTATYLTEPAKSIIYNNPPLLLQFLYAAWNGPVFFGVISNLVKNAVANGTKDPATLYNMVSQTRRTYKNSELYRIGADKLDAICNQYLGGVPSTSGGKSWLWLLIGGIALYGITRLSTNKKRSRK